MQPKQIARCGWEGKAYAESARRIQDEFEDTGKRPLSQHAHAVDPDLATAIELVEAEAWAQLQGATPREWQERHGVCVSRRGGAALLASRTAVLPLNRVIALGCAKQLSESLLDKVIAEYAGAGVREFVIQWSPAARPREAMAWFASSGGKTVSPTAKLYRATSGHVAHVDSNLRVEEIGPAQADLYEQVVADALGVPDGIGAIVRSTVGRPGWHFYLAFDEHRPVAGGASYVRGRHAWFGLTATLASDRHRGAQRALLARRLHDAAAAGCEWVSADTLPDTPDAPNPSLRNLYNAGFSLLYERPNVLFSRAASR